MVRLDGTGDVLLAGPAVRAVAAVADRVTFISGAAGAEAARLLPGVDEVDVFEAPWVALAPRPVDPGAVAAVVARWLHRRIDAAVVLTSAHQSPLPTALLLKLAGVARVAGASSDHPGSLLDVRLRTRTGHEVERNLALVGACGYPAPSSTALQIDLPPASAPPTPAGAVVVHPGASVPARALPPAATNQLVAALLRHDVPVVLTGAAAETAPVRAAAPAGPLIDLGGRTDLAQLAVVMARCGAVVVGNTGPAHLAAALDVPIVSVFAPTVPAPQWGPWSASAELLGRLAVPCAGCRARACPFPGQPCTAEVDGAALLAAVARATGRSLDPRPRAMEPS
ncbi:MAG: glycosyltransferase family 9 protein [Acidimicrobiales bacterium]|nr:glycosyltransferase family 9 protein [Acidimicrobiales bacterium]